MASNEPKKNFGRKPVHTIPIPREFRTESLQSGLNRRVQEWKSEYGIEAVPIFEGRRIIRLDLYGAAANLNVAIQAINKWMKTANNKSAPTNAWPKTPAFDENKWYYCTIESMEAQRKEMFKGPIPDDSSPLSEAIVAWPIELLQREPAITPRDAFGNKLEALDTLRVDDEVFISLRPPPNPRWEVIIQGFKIEDVEAAEEHYNNLSQKVLLKTLLGTTTLNIILDEQEGEDIVLEPVQDWWPIKADKIAPRLNVFPMNDPGSFRHQSFGPTTLSEIQEALRQSFEAVRYSRGSYNLAIRFGCIALQGLADKEIGNTYPLQRFKKAIDGNIPCHAKKWLYDCKDGKQHLLGRLMSAKHLLEPVKTSSGFSGFRPRTLEQTRPTYQGTWAFHDPSVGGARKQQTTPQKGDPLNLIVVQVTWSEDEDAMYEKMPAQFFRLKTGAPTEHMDINLLELGQSKAWHFGLESMESEPRYRVPLEVVAFADTVSIKAGLPPDSIESFAVWPKSPSLRLHFGRLEKLYTFGIIKTGYHVEAATMWYPGTPRPCWGMAVRHRDWEMHVNQLERMPPGRGADWEDPIKTFFPDDGISADHENEGILKKLGKLRVNDESEWEGIRLLMRKLMELSYIVDANTDLNLAQKGPSLGMGLAMRDSPLFSSRK